MSTASDETRSIELYGHNLTRLARQGAFAPLAGQEAIANRVLHVLSRRNKCCPFILDTNETRRSAIIIEVVRQMALGETSEPFPQTQVIALDFEALFDNLSEETPRRQEQRAQMLPKWKQRQQQYAEMWGSEGSKQFPLPDLEAWINSDLVLERLQSLITDMRQAEGSFILFVDNFHWLIGGSTGKYAIDTSNLLIPVLSRRQIELIGTCSLEQYRKYIERDAAFQRRFQEIVPPEARREYRPDEV